MHSFKGFVSKTFQIFLLVILMCETVLTENGSNSKKLEDAIKRTLDLTNEDAFYNLSIKPISASYPVTIYMGETTHLTFSYGYSDSVGNNISSGIDTDTFSGNYSLVSFEPRSIFVSINREDLAEIVNKTTIPIKTDNGTFVLALKGKLPGRANLLFKFGSTNNEASFKIYIELQQRTLDIVFTIVVIMLVVLANIGMGAKVDLNIVKKELKRPIAPVIGMCSQFIVMPLIAFTLAYNLSLDPGIALGFFALGCSPGGSASNAFTYLLKGNISLSVTMTLISSLASLGFFPLWLFTLGRLIYNEGNVQIPYSNIFLSLIGIVAPVGVGLFLKWKFPKVAEFFINSVKYIILVFFVFVLSVGIYANWFIFFLVNWDIIIAAACLPYLGFVFGGILAALTRQPKANIIAIAVETGIQNTGIPIILLRLSLSGPDKNTGIVIPVMSAIFTPIPIMVAIFYVQTKAWLKRRRNSKDIVAEGDTDSVEMVSTLSLTG